MAKTKMVPVEGNTYPIREQLAALGGKWNPKHKQWFVPEDRALEALDLLMNAPAPTSKARSQSKPRIRGWDGKIGSPSYYASGAFDEIDQ